MSSPTKSFISVQQKGEGPIATLPCIQLGTLVSYLLDFIVCLIQNADLMDFFELLGTLSKTGFFSRLKLR